MRIGNFLLLIGGGMLAYLAFKASAGSKVQFFPRGVDLSKFRLTDPVVGFQVELVNPTFTELSVNSVNLQILNGSEVVGRILYLNKITIPGPGKMLVNLPVTLALGASVTLIAKAIQGKISEVTLSGSFNSMGFEVPVNTKIPFLT